MSTDSMTPVEGNADLATQVERLRAAYEKVKFWPENNPTGLVDLLELRNLVPEAAARIEALEAENARLIGAIHWALGYTNFRERGEREGAYWWRKELRQRADVDEKIEQFVPCAALPHP